MILKSFIGKPITGVSENVTSGILMTFDLGVEGVGEISVVLGRWELFSERNRVSGEREMIASSRGGSDKFSLLLCLLDDSIVRVTSIYREMIDIPDFGFHIMIKFLSGRVLYVFPYKRPNMSLNPPMLHAPLLNVKSIIGSQTHLFSGAVAISMNEEIDQEVNCEPDTKNE